MAKQPPTVICNKFAIIAGGPFIRFAFGEQVLVNGDVDFHSAIMMSGVDAKELADSIYKTIEQMNQAQTSSEKITVN